MVMNTVAQVEVVHSVKVGRKMACCGLEGHRPSEVAGSVSFPMAALTFSSASEKSGPEPHQKSKEETSGPCG